MTLDAARRAAIKERCAKASPEPWRIARDSKDAEDWWATSALETVIVSGPDGFHVCATNDDGLADEQEVADAEFIAASRTDLPLVLTTLERVERENHKLRELVSFLRIERSVYRRALEEIRDAEVDHQSHCEMFCAADRAKAAIESVVDQAIVRAQEQGNG